MQDDRTAPSASRRKLFDGSFLFVLGLAVLSGAAVLWLKGAERFWEILARDIGLSVAILPKVVAGVLIASALPFLLPRERVLRLIGPKSGIRGLAIAAAAGAVFPGGPAVTYPMTVGLMAAGADLGAGVAVVSGWVLLGLNRTIIWELSFLPPEFVALRVALSLPAPIVFGLIVRRVMRRRGAAC
ncbi:MAG: permease [Rhodovulum sp.]